MSDFEIPPSSIAFYDQQVAEGGKWLDAFVQAHKVDAEKYGETLATMGLSETILGINQYVLVSNLLTLAIQRLAKA